MADHEQSPPVEKELEERLRRALATPPISNEEIVMRSKANAHKPHKARK